MHFTLPQLVNAVFNEWPVNYVTNSQCTVNQIESKVHRIKSSCVFPGSSGSSTKIGQLKIQDTGDILQ